MILSEQSTFVINLPKRIDRLEFAKTQLSRYAIPFTLWKATYNDNGRLGLIQTMKELFEYAIKENLNHIFALEDDFHFVANPNTYLSICLKQLPENFHLFYLGCNLSKPPVRYSDNLLQTKAAYSSHAIIYSLEAIEMILHKIDTAIVYDMFLVNNIQKFGRSFCAYPLLASQTNGFSDIEKRDVNYERFLEKRFYKNTQYL